MYICAGCYYAPPVDGVAVQYSDPNYGVATELYVFPEYRLAQPELPLSFSELVDAYDRGERCAPVVHGRKAAGSLREPRRHAPAPKAPPRKAPLTATPRDAAGPSLGREGGDDAGAVAQSRERLVRLCALCGSDLDGWCAWTSRRSHGAYAGQLDTYFFSPSRRRRFRSINDAAKHVRKLAEAL